MSPGPRSATLASAPESWRAGRFAATSLSSQDRGALIRVVCAFLLTRMVLYVTGAIAIRMLPPNSALPAEAFLGKNLSLVGWVRWDAGWYLSIVERGYWIDPTRTCLT